MYFYLVVIFRRYSLFLDLRKVLLLVLKVFISILKKVVFTPPADWMARVRYATQV